MIDALHRIDAAIRFTGTPIISGRVEYQDFHTISISGVTTSGNPATNYQVYIQHIAYGKDHSYYTSDTL
jgi:hypothetical protein